MTNSSHLVVTPHPVTLSQYIGYLGIATAVGGSILGGLMKIPPYISEKKQARTLRDCILDINNKYNKFKLASQTDVCV